MEYWLGVFDEAFPIRHVVSIVICLGVLFIGGDKVHEYYTDAADVVEEIVKKPKPKLQTATYVPEQSTPPVYAVGQDETRLLLI